MKHTLSNCRLALNWYTWRHNEVLKVLTEMTKEQVEEGNTLLSRRNMVLSRSSLYRKDARFLTESRQTKP